jgi:ABC-2 type transport system permease protein
MNPALWRKAISDSWVQLLVSCLLLFAFSWIFIWLMNMFHINTKAPFFTTIPKFIEKLTDIPMAELTSPMGRISLVFVHVVPMVICLGWAVGRGSDTISGEAGRGTLELLATLPIRRYGLLLPPAVVSAVGAFCLAFSLWLGVAVGVTLNPTDEPIPWSRFTPGAVNLACMIICVHALTVFLSSWISNRWRTILIAIGIFILSFILEMTGRLWTGGFWLRYVSFLRAFQPQELILATGTTPLTAYIYNGSLLIVALAFYLLAAFLFWRRDIPTVH